VCRSEFKIQPREFSSLCELGCVATAESNQASSHSLVLFGDSCNETKLPSPGKKINQKS